MLQPLRISLLLMFIFTAAAQAATDLKVTEWGTFTSLVGSNGVTVDGMYHEDEVLPDFVHPFGAVLGETAGRTQPVPQPDPGEDDQFCGKMPCRFLRNNRITQKMETPVIYFYSQAGVRNVNVDVRFPEGAISETYPAPVSTFPGLNDAPVLANGHTVFNVNVLSEFQSMYTRHHLPQVPAGNIYGHARLPQSNVVVAGKEKESFIFYRGVGRFQPATRIRFSGGTLTLAQNFRNQRIPAVFLVNVNASGEAQGRFLGALEPGRTITVPVQDIDDLKTYPSHAKLTMGNADLSAALRRELAGAGLSPDEANAMVNTWEHGYLKTPGFRLLYILPDEEVEFTLPMQITPQPDSLTRVFVGRIELLSGDDEQHLLSLVRTQRDLFDVANLGRFAEPILRRVLAVYQDEDVVETDIVNLFQRLIARAKQL